ncbi:MAG: hypothetical protein R2845_07080 [Thermomicrobiales bacterium]
MRSVPEGRLLVVDAGTRRVERFGSDGSPDVDFQNRLEADLTANALDLLDPVNVAVVLRTGRSPCSIGAGIA